MQAHPRSEEPYSREAVDRLRAAVPLSSLIVPTVKLKRAGPELVGLCPFHNEKTPSFSVNDEKGVYHCHGCGASGDAVTWLERLNQKGFRAAVDDLTGYAGGAVAFERAFNQKAEAYKADPFAASLGRYEAGRMEEAQAIWNGAGPIAGTLGQVYLATRGLRPLADTLRFHKNCVIAPLIDRRGTVRAVQRIYLDKTGNNLKRDGKSVRLTLGPMGGAAVRFGAGLATVGIAESVEKAMAARQLFSVPCWAALGAQRLGKIDLPKETRTVVIFADGDDTGRREADRAAMIYDSQGRTAQLMLPPKGIKDWDDITKGETR